MAQRMRLTVASEIFDNLHSLFEDDETPGSFQMRQLQKTADALMGVNAVDGSIALAGIAALNWDVDAALKWSRNAATLDRRSISALHNSIVTMEKLNQMNEVASLAREMLEKAPRNEQVRRHAITSLNGAGYVADALFYLEQGVELGIDLRSEYVGLSEVADALAFHKIGKDHIVTEIRLAAETLTAHRKRARTVEQDVFVDHDGKVSVYVKIGFWGDVREQLQLEADLAAKLAELPDWNPDAFSTEFAGLDREKYADSTSRDTASST